jgi:exodeoxyribonuclease VIII
MSKQNQHLMIDLETLSTLPEAAILTVGALWFDPYSFNEPGPGFYRRVEIDGQDRHVCNDTMAWWADQKAEVREEAFTAFDRVSLTDTLRDLAKFAQNADSVWAHGTTFDIVILEHAYQQMDIAHHRPWKYYQVRDCRTVIKISHVPVLRDEQAHNALVDCWHQVQALQQAFYKLGLHATG